MAGLALEDLEVFTHPASGYKAVRARCHIPGGAEVGHYRQDNETRHLALDPERGNLSATYEGPDTILLRASRDIAPGEELFIRGEEGPPTFTQVVEQLYAQLMALDAAQREDVAFVIQNDLIKALQRVLSDAGAATHVPGYEGVKRQCNTCREWKPETNDHFYSIGAHYVTGKRIFYSPCKACRAALKRRRT